MDITLNWVEATVASEVGRMRHLKSLKDGRQDAYGFDGDGWTEHIEGATGEMVVCKALGIYWNCTIDAFDECDLPGMQVRTRSRHDYELIVRPDDKEDAKWVLVTGKCPSYRVVGWINGVDAKNEAWLHGHGGRPPAYFVPHWALRPISELLAEGTPARTDQCLGSSMRP